MKPNPTRLPERRQFLAAAIAMPAACVFATRFAGARTNADTETAEYNALTKEEKAGGWRLLFDGKSMDAWRRFNGDKFGEQWKVEAGAMVLTAGGGGDVITKEQFDSFELVLEYAIAPGGNSGLMFHVQEGDPEPGMNGPEVQLLDNAGGGDPQKAGWLYALYPAPNDPKTGQPVDATKPAGEWNRLRLVLDGPNGSIEMNGVKYASFEMWGDEWNRRVAASKFVKWPKFGHARTGHICLQDHGARIAFRSVKIRPIKQR
jgi:hypothetical protein